MTKDPALFDELSPTEFMDRCECGEPWQLLDVREPWEVATASVSIAMCIPMAEVANRLDELDHSRPVAVLCRSGARSAQIAELLVNKGFAAVANISGGINAWSQQLDAGIPRY